MGMLGVLGLLGPEKTTGEHAVLSQGNFSSLPPGLKNYGQETLSLCYSLDEFMGFAHKYDLTGASKLIYKNQIETEHSFITRLSGEVQLMSLVYCAFFDKDTIEREHWHKEILKEMQGTELETLIVDKALDNPAEFKDLNFRAVHGRIIYAGATDDFIRTISAIPIPFDKKIDLISYWNNAFGHIYAGQSMDIAHIKKEPIFLSDYVKTITQTTARYIQLTAKLGAVISRMTPKEEHAVLDYALHMGVAFQLRDDWEDMENDIYEGKSRAFFISEAVNRLPKSDREFVITNYLSRPKEVIGLLKKSTVPDYVRVLNNEYVEIARKHIGGITASHTRDRLNDIADVLRI